MGKIVKFLCALFCSFYGVAECNCLELDFSTAWQRLVNYSPLLGATAAEVEMKLGEKRQAGLFPNPILVIEAENLGVSDRHCEAEPPQVTYALSQLIEFGGKRGARLALAEAEVDIAYWQSKIAEHDLRLGFLKAFITVAFAQEKTCCAREQERVACCALNAIERELCEGKVSRLQQKKGQIQWRAAQVSVREAEANLEIAKRELSSFWGAACPDFDCVIYDFFSCQPLTCLDEFLVYMSQTPDYLHAQSRIFAARREFNLQRAYRVPDVSLTVGYRTFNDSNEHGWIVGAEMPLPLLNLNQGNIQKASYCVCQAHHLFNEFAWEQSERLTVTWERLLASYEESELIREGILCDANEALNLTEQGYQFGKIDYFEFLEAQKMRCEVEEQYLDTIYNYHLYRAELARLTGFKGLL